jgi:hypothetical protein
MIQYPTLRRSNAKAVIYNTKEKQNKTFHNLQHSEEAKNFLLISKAQGEALQSFTEFKNSREAMQCFIDI